MQIDRQNSREKLLPAAAEIKFFLAFEKWLQLFTVYNIFAVRLSVYHYYYTHLTASFSGQPG